MIKNQKYENRFHLHETLFFYEKHENARNQKPKIVFIQTLLTQNVLIELFRLNRISDYWIFISGFYWYYHDESSLMTHQYKFATNEEQNYFCSEPFNCKRRLKRECEGEII